SRSSMPSSSSRSSWRSSSRSWPDRRAVGLALASLAAAPLLAADAPAPAPDGAPPAVVELPFVRQGPRLCGGAAAAMVLRYWGVSDASAEDFAPLVDESLDGIPVVALVRDLGARGFRVVPFRGESAEVAHHLARGRPVIALVE